MVPKAEFKRATFALILIALAIVTESVADRQVSSQASNLNATTSFVQQQRADSLQAHLNQIQQQVQRQLSQFNGLVMNAAVGNANTNATNRQSSNVLDALSTVGRAIHQQISAATNPNHVNIVSGSGGLNLAQSASSPQELANNKKNEYQPVHATDLNSGAASSVVNSATGLSPSNANYREQVEVLRHEITRRAGQLQQVVAGSMDLLKNNGDLIMRNLLAQMNNRLDQAKAKADRIISSEPLAMNEMTVRTLNTINSGLNNLNTIIANIVARIDSANKADQQKLNQPTPNLTPLQQRVQQAANGADQMAPALAQMIDTSRIRTNLQQLSQQFAQAINGTSLHQQLSLLRNQRIQQQQAAALPSVNSVSRENIDTKLQQQQQAGQ